MASAEVFTSMKIPRHDHKAWGSLWFSVFLHMFVYVFIRAFHSFFKSVFAVEEACFLSVQVEGAKLYASAEAGYSRWALSLWSRKAPVCADHPPQHLIPHHHTLLSSRSGRYESLHLSEKIEKSLFLDFSSPRVAPSVRWNSITSNSWKQVPVSAVSLNQKEISTRWRRSTLTSFPCTLGWHHLY